MKIKIKYGVDAFEKEFSTPPTVHQIKTDQRIKAALGFGDNIRVLVNDIEMDNDAVIPETEVRIETACNQKAV